MTQVPIKVTVAMTGTMNREAPVSQTCQILSTHSFLFLALVQSEEHGAGMAASQQERGDRGCPVGGGPLPDQGRAPVQGLYVDEQLSRDRLLLESRRAALRDPRRGRLVRALNPHNPPTLCIARALNLPFGVWESTRNFPHFQCFE